MEGVISRKIVKFFLITAFSGLVISWFFWSRIPTVHADAFPSGTWPDKARGNTSTLDALACPVIGYSQHDPIFQPDLLTASCLNPADTMSSAGCAITTLAMMLKYYGVNTTPRILDDKLGTDGCPLSSHWGDLATVDGPTSSVAYVGAQNGTLSSLSTTIANDLSNDHPTVLHLELSDGTDHYVLAISGSGSSAGNYQIVDSSDGLQKSLQAKYDQGYTVAGIIRYSGLPACLNNLQNPTNLDATDDLHDKVVITWDAVPNATTYEVWRYPTNVWQAAKRLTKSVTSTSFNDMSGDVDISYAYWVAACNSNGCTPLGDRVRGMRTSVVVPPAPTDVDATKDEVEKVTVTWGPIATATRYEIWRHTSNVSSASTLIASNATSPYDDTTGTIGRPYVYWVKACNDDGCSDFSNQHYGNSLLATPTNVDASDGTMLIYIRVAYTNVNGAEGYEIWRNTSNNLATATLIFLDNYSPYHESTAVPGVVYYYWVRAYNDYTTSGFSSPDSGYQPILHDLYLPLVTR